MTVKVEPMRLALVATTCPTCGTIRVSGVTSTPLTIDLRSPTRIDRAVIDIDLCAEEGCPDDPWKATLTVKVITTGKPVIIDGLAVG